MNFFFLLLLFSSSSSSSSSSSFSSSSSSSATVQCGPWLPHSILLHSFRPLATVCHFLIPIIFNLLQLHHSIFYAAFHFSLFLPFWLSLFLAFFLYLSFRYVHAILSEWFCKFTFALCNISCVLVCSYSPDFFCFVTMNIYSILPFE